MSFKGFPTFSFDGHFVQRSGPVLVEGHQRNISMKLFWNWSFKGSSIFSFGSHYFQHNGTIFANFGSGSLKVHFCEIILKSGHWSRRRCHLELFSPFSFGGHFVQPSQTILINLVEGHPRNISVKNYFEISPLVQEMSFKEFLFLALVAILFSGAEWF